MQDLSDRNHELTLEKLRARQEDVMKEINDDLAEMHEDLLHLVGDFTSVLSEKAEKDSSYNSNRISDIGNQVRRLNETMAVVTTFSRIFQQFNTMTTKILSFEAIAETNFGTLNDEVTPLKEARKENFDSSTDFAPSASRYYASPPVYDKFLDCATDVGDPEPTQSTGLEKRLHGKIVDRKRNYSDIENASDKTDADPGIRLEKNIGQADTNKRSG